MPRCPDCHWHLRFKSAIKTRHHDVGEMLTAKVSSYEWIAFCWNPQCPTKEVEAE